MRVGARFEQCSGRARQHHPVSHDTRRQAHAAKCSSDQCAALAVSAAAAAAAGGGGGAPARRKCAIASGSARPRGTAARQMCGRNDARRVGCANVPSPSADALGASARLGLCFDCRVRPLVACGGSDEVCNAAFEPTDPSSCSRDDLADEERKGTSGAAQQQQRRPQVANQQTSSGPPTCRSSHLRARVETARPVRVHTDTVRMFTRTCAKAATE